MRIGLHLGGSLDRSIPAFYEKAKPGIGIIQVLFNSPQRYWPASRFADQAIMLKISEFMKKEDVKVVVHAPYVFTLNQPDKTRKALERHLAYCDGLGIETLVVHSGTWRDPLLNNPVDDWVRFLEPFVDRYRSMVLLENMAYKEGAMTDQELNAVCDRVKCGICLDTAHAWIGRAPMNDLDPRHVKLIHLNQTDSPQGSGRDRHSQNQLNDGLIEMNHLQNTLRRYPHADAVSEYAGPRWRVELDLLWRIKG